MKILTFLFAIATTAALHAENRIDDFETRPNAPFAWQTVNDLTSGFADYTFTGGTLRVSTDASVSGDQSLKFFTDASAGATLTATSGTTGGGGGGVRFLDVSLRLPVAQILSTTNPATWSPGVAQLWLNGIPAMIVRNGSAVTAQLYLYNSGGIWNAFGGALELDDSNQNLKQWLRLSVRTDATAGISDLWENGKITVINHPPDAASGSDLILRLASSQSAYLDNVQTGDAHPLYPDTDRDGMADLWEYEQGTDANVNDRSADPDEDTIDNITEYWIGTKPNDDDSDDDDLPDNWERANGLNPASNADRNVDYDMDGFTSYEEWQAGTDPNDSTQHSTHVLYVKAGIRPEEHGTDSEPFSTIQAALNAVATVFNPDDPVGWRIVLHGGEGIFTGAGNSDLTVSVPVTILGRSNATLQGTTTSRGFYTTFPPSAGPFIVEDVSFLWMSGGSDGGAVFSDQVPVQLRRCQFSNCRATNIGGAVFINHADLLMEDCVFTNCNSEKKGGALCVQNAGLDIRRCRFLACNSWDGDGAAVYLGSSTPPAGGHARTSGVFENCLFSGNYVVDSGAGAIGIGGDSSPVFRYCTILSNTVSNAAPAGAGGIVNTNPTLAVTLDSCILWGNKNGTVFTQVNGSTQQLADGTLWSAGYCTVQGQTLSGTGNNSTDPWFVTNTPLLRAAYSHLAANPGTTPPVTVDLDGLTRTTPRERGAYEFADDDGDGLPSSWEIKFLLNPANKADSEEDADQDGYTNREEFIRGSDPRVVGLSECYSCIYVDPHPPFVDPLPGATGSQYGTITSPVRSINGALQLRSSSRPRIALRNGTYTGTANRSLNCSGGYYGGTFMIKSINGPGSVIVDMEGLGRFLCASASGYAPLNFTIHGIEFRRGSAPAGQNGGAFLASGGSQDLILEKCTFTGCAAVSGGAVAYESSPGATGRSCQLTDCLFQGCSATTRGGAFSCNATTDLRLERSTFMYNDAAVEGGALYSPATSGLSIKSCVFHRNASPYGGAVSVQSASTWSNVSNLGGSNFNNYITGCVFTENIAASQAEGITNRGGALALTASSTDLHACRFSGNLAAWLVDGWARGGALYINGGAPSIFGSDFSGNQCGEQGGAVCITGYGGSGNATGPPGGSAPGGGPGIPRLANCSLHGNSAPLGGAVYVGGLPANSHGDALLAHCTLTGNTSTFAQGSALYAGGDVEFYNNLTWYNSPAAAQLTTPEGGPNTITGNGNNTQPVVTAAGPGFAFDGIHLREGIGGGAATGRNYISELYPGTSSYGYYDYDREVRPSWDNEPGCDCVLDTDGDGLPDWFEDYIINLSANDELVPGTDITPGQYLGTSNYDLAAMYRYGGDPAKPDTAQAYIDSDGDGISDLEETALGTNPESTDSDGDGLSDDTELAGGTNPTRFDMPVLQVMEFWRDALIEDWRADSPEPANNLQWPIYSTREVSALATNTSEVTKSDWSAGSRGIIEGRIPNVIANEAIDLLWNEAGDVLAWGEPVSAGNSIGAWMLQSFSREEPQKIHSIRARTVKIFLKASRPMPIEFKVQLKVKRYTRSGPDSDTFGTATTLSTPLLSIMQGATESQTPFEFDPTDHAAVAVEPMGLNQLHTVGEAYYAITVEPFPYELWPVYSAEIDPDTDGLPSSIEQSIGTNPNSSDTDTDGRPDLFDFLSPLPVGVAATAAGSGSPLVVEPPIIEYVYRDGHVCPTVSFTAATGGKDVMVKGVHWQIGRRHKFFLTPPVSPITAIEEFWQTEFPPNLSFPAAGVPPAIEYTGTPYGMVDRRFAVRDDRPKAIFPLRSYTSLTQYQILNPPRTELGGDASEVLVRIRRSTATGKAVSKSFTLIGRQKADTTAAEWTYTSVTTTTLTIDPNETASVPETNPIALPSAVTPPANKISMHERLMVPVELFLDNNNAPYVPNTEALGVSNFVTTIGLPVESEFDAVCNDPENFRLQADLWDTSATSVLVELCVMRGGSTVSIQGYVLNKKHDKKVRGRFLRLVADSYDDAASGVSDNTDPHQQTILVKLGDTLRASYEIQPGLQIFQDIQVGRPSGESDNGDDPKKHDIRLLKVNFLVFKKPQGGPCVTLGELQQMIEYTNECYAQAGIKLEPQDAASWFGPDGNGAELTPSLVDGFDDAGIGTEAPTADEYELVAKRDSDPNSIDVFIAQKLNTPLIRNTQVRSATSYPQSRASLLGPEQRNWFIMPADAVTGRPLTPGHEMMHCLLNREHRLRHLEPEASLFFAPVTPKAVDGTKRIGPFQALTPKLTSEVSGDTYRLREAAEQLP